MFKKIEHVGSHVIGMDREVELAKELCEHLKQIGVNATLSDSVAPVAGGLVMGGAKIDGHSIDLVQIERYVHHNPGPKGGSHKYYQYHYIVQAKVDALENRFNAYFSPIEKRKGLFSKEIIGYQWEGGDLASPLNADSDLKNMLLQAELTKINIGFNKELQCVRITPIMVESVSESFLKGPFHKAGKELPTLESFKALDRIAQHIRHIIGNLAS